jgi:hypothetical protein
VFTPVGRFEFDVSALLLVIMAGARESAVMRRMAPIFNVLQGLADATVEIRLGRKMRARGL